VLRAEGLAAIRGERLVFSGLDLAVPAGGALLLRGANGAGKSTLLRLLAGLRRPDAGRVLWRNTDIAEDRTAHGLRLRYLGHQDAIKPGLSVAENLAFDARARGGAIPDALAVLGLAPLASLPARLLSAGQRRRLALARLALAPVPLWLLDEPTLGLDSAAQDRLGQLIATHRAAGGLLVAATHVPLPLAGAAELVL
jgi:heme exporter protein A